MSNQSIKEIDGLRKYRTEIPNIADDDMDVFQYRLYGHYKRVCGAAGGECFESVRTTAEKTRMSPTKVIETRQWLAENGWVEIEKTVNSTVHVTITDKWSDNFQRLSVPNMEQPNALVFQIWNSVFQIWNSQTPLVFQIWNQRRNIILRRN